MNKFTTIVFTTILFFMSSNASATLITSDLTADTYITDNGLDWTWASRVNTQFYDLDPTDNIDFDNELKAPDFHQGWRFATADELNYLLNNLTLADFTRNDGTFIHSASYWNTSFTEVDPINLMFGAVGSTWVSKFAFNNYFETFYVRSSQPTPTPVPEPTNVALLAIGLIGLVLRKKFK